MSQADAVIKRLSNMRVGMTTVENGKLVALEEHTPGWFNATWERGSRRTCYSHPAGLLLTVVRH